MKYLKSIFAAVLVCSIAQAAIITSIPVDDARVPDTNQDGLGDGLANATDKNITTGDAANNQNLSATVFVFALPTLDAGETITNASVSWFLNNKQNNPPNLQVDVFFKNPGEVVRTDYEAASVLTLQDFITPTSTTQILHTWDNDVDSDLVALLNTACASGTKHVVFRLSLQGWTTGNGDANVDGYSVRTMENDDAGTRPTLTIQTIPEPGSVGLLVLGLLGTFCIRQFRKG